MSLQHSLFFHFAPIGDGSVSRAQSPDMTDNIDADPQPVSPSAQQPKRQGSASASASASATATAYRRRHRESDAFSYEAKYFEPEQVLLKRLPPLTMDIDEKQEEYEGMTAIVTYSRFASMAEELCSLGMQMRKK